MHKWLHSTQQMVTRLKIEVEAHVLFNYLNEFGKKDRMQGLLCSLSLFRSKFNKSNNAGEGMLDSIYHMTLKLIKKIAFLTRKRQYLVIFFTQRDNGRHWVT